MCAICYGPRITISRYPAFPVVTITTMGALAIVDRLLRGNFELGIKITLGFFLMRS